MLKHPLPLYLAVLLLSDPPPILQSMIDLHSWNVERILPSRNLVNSLGVLRFNSMALSEIIPIVTDLPTPWAHCLCAILVTLVMCV